LVESSKASHASGVGEHQTYSRKGRRELHLVAVANTLAESEQ
jgi:hypothetical protein